jgi:hypothetical protein
MCRKENQNNPVSRGDPKSFFKELRFQKAGCFAIRRKTCNPRGCGGGTRDHGGRNQFFVDREMFISGFGASRTRGKREDRAVKNQ